MTQRWQFCPGFYAELLMEQIRMSQEQEGISNLTQVHLKLKSGSMLKKWTKSDHEFKL